MERSYSCYQVWHQLCMYSKKRKLFVVLSYCRTKKIFSCYPVLWYKEKIQFWRSARKLSWTKFRRTSSDNRTTVLPTKLSSQPGTFCSCTRDILTTTKCLRLGIYIYCISESSSRLVWIANFSIILHFKSQIENLSWFERNLVSYLWITGPLLC